MSLRFLKVLAPDTQKATLKELATEDGILEHWSSSKSQADKQREFNFLVSSDHLQSLTDKIQSLMHKEKDWRVVILPVETAIPRYDPDDDDEAEEEENVNAKKTHGGLTRETLYDQILKGARTNTDFYILVVLSTLVTAIGLITNNLAVIIGAMVIAPLLGPNLALSFGIALGERDMIQEALKANTTGLTLTVLIALLAGLLVPSEYFIASQEFLSRTDADFSGIVLALASGAAAVLSLTGGVSSTMVGVMVAVALMPPAVAMGLSAGAGLFPESYGAALLLAMNIICVNLAAQIVLTFKGIKPRTWYRRKKSNQSVRISLIFWALWLFILIAVITLRQYT